MVKTLVFLLLSFLSCIGFQDNEILSFEYGASTRGLSMKVIIRKDSTFVWVQGKETKMKTSRPDWVLLNQRIAQFDLKKMELLEAPTEERYSDKALRAKLIVTTKSHSYESNEFDHGNSPEEIYNIVEVLTLYLPSE